MEKHATPPLPALPMQLMLCLGTWQGSLFALQCAKNAWPLWKPPMDLPPNGDLTAAVAKEASARANNLLSGVLRYLETPYHRALDEKPAVWSKGNARLLDYGTSSPRRGEVGRGAWSERSRDLPPPGGGITLFVPSLINRYYILDLEKERSLLRYLAAAGVHPLVLDWGMPGASETGFGCNEYITEILLPAIEFIHQSSGRPVSLAGYCMGGVLSLAAAQLKPKQVASLVLLATPWNFHCKEFAPFVVDSEWHAMLGNMIGAGKTLSADVIQSLFYMTDPWVFEQKFRRFAALKGEAAQDFVALERWVNDGVPMTSRLAQDCLIGWAQKNQLAAGGWKIEDKGIDPARIKQPAFIAMPKNDHVVPYHCALPLAEAIPHAKVINPGAGHVGMVVGQQARKELWEPLAKWLLQRHPERA